MIALPRIQFDRMTGVLEECAIKISAHVGYNVFGTPSALWQGRINALSATRRMQ